MAKIHSIYRYPIKGLSPEPLARAALTPGETIPGDRLYAIENGPSGFDPAAPAYLSKTHFLMLMKNERLATPAHLVRSGQPTRSPSLPRNERRIVQAATCAPPKAAPRSNASSPLLRRTNCAGRRKSCTPTATASPTSPSKVVSIINLASVAAVEAMVGAPVHPLRFRGNVYVEGWPAWSELDLVGKELSIGDARLENRQTHRPLRRHQCRSRHRACATSNCRKTLLRTLGHADCGIYAEVIEGGEIAAGDGVEIL